MPLARIITESIDDSLELSMQLRARGFQVETVSPDQIPASAADLEVRLEECAPEDVLAKAAQVGESEDLWVFVAPGALDERSRPMRTISLHPHSADRPAPRMGALRAEGQAGTDGLAWKAEEDVILSDVAVAHPQLSSAEVSPREMRASSDSAQPMLPEAPPVIAASTPASMAPKTNGEVAAPKVKVVVLPKLAETPQIPEVPLRAEPIKLVPPPLMPAPKRIFGPYKISFRTGSAFRKRTSVVVALVVVLGLVAIVVALRPSSPTASRPVAAPAIPVARPALEPQLSGPTPAANAAAEAGIAKKHNASPSKAQRPQQAEHPAGWKSDREIIAEDTVVFYDRKPGSAAKKPAPRPARPHSNEN